MWSYVFFGLSLLSAALIYGLAIASLLTGKFQFWPPPDKSAWQAKVFLILFRGMVYPLIALSALKFRPPSSTVDWLICSAGGFMLLVGLTVAFAATFRMGYANAFGDNTKLTTTGLFKFSRNPVYVATMFGLVGWAILINDALVWSILGLWAGLYIIAPFLEEPWLEREYGEAYLSYKKTVRRFI